MFLFYNNLSEIVIRKGRFLLFLNELETGGNNSDYIFNGKFSL